MHSPNSKIVVQRKLIIIIADIFVLCMAVVMGWALAEVLKEEVFAGLLTMEWREAASLIPILFGFPSLVIILASGFQGHYGRFRPFWDEFADLIKIVLSAAGMVIIYLYLSKLHFSRLWFFSSWTLVLLLLPVGRLAAKKHMMQLGIWFTPAVIIGNGPLALESAEAVESDPLLGVKVIALLRPDKESENSDIPFKEYYIGDHPEETLKELDNPYVVLALESNDYEKHGQLVDRLSSSQANMSIIPPLRGMPLLGSKVSYVFRHEVLILRVQNNLSRQGPLLLKRSFDIVVSFILLMLLSPFFAFFAWNVRRDGGDAFFGHDRVGRSAKLFKCYKFRTMVPNAQDILEETLAKDDKVKAEWEKDFKLKDDPRITKAGRFLRGTSLDELPQLWNVLKGEMSLVGPRPIVQGEVERYGEQIDLYYETWPGMTGMWQVSGRSDTDYARRVKLDTWYVRNWSLWYDIVILLKTIPVVFTRDGAY